MMTSFSPKVVRAWAKPDLRRRAASSLPSWCGMETTRGRAMPGIRTTEYGGRTTDNRSDPQLDPIRPPSSVVRLPPDGVALHAAWIGGGAAPAAFARGRREPAFRPIRADLDDMAAALELAHCLFRNAALDDEHARPRGAWPE